MISTIEFGDCTVTRIAEKKANAPASDGAKTTQSEQVNIGELLKKRKEETGMNMLERYNANVSKEETEAFCKKHTTLCGLKKFDDKFRKFLLGHQ